MSASDILKRIEALQKPDTTVEVWIWDGATESSRMVEGEACVDAINSLSASEEVSGVIYYGGHNNPASEVFTTDPDAAENFREQADKVAKRQSRLRTKYGK
jgi:hypothetical protein